MLSASEPSAVPQPVMAASNTQLFTSSTLRKGVKWFHLEAIQCQFSTPTSAWEKAISGRERKPASLTWATCRLLLLSLLSYISYYSVLNYEIDL